MRTREGARTRRRGTRRASASWRARLPSTPDGPRADRSSGSGSPRASRQRSSTRCEPPFSCHPATLAVWDAFLRRLTILDPATGGVRVLPLRTDEAALATDVLPDGSIVGKLGEVFVGPGDTTSVRRPRRPYARFDPEGRQVAPLAVLSDDEHFVWAEDGSRSVRPRAFGRSTFVRASAEGDAVLVADNRGFEIRVLDPSGSHLETWRRRVETGPVTEEDRQRWTDAELEALGKGFLRRVSERALRAMDFPEAMPFHGELLPSTDGGAWLRSYSPPHAGGPSEWTVFGADGRAVAVVTLPPGFRPTWTDGERVLGVEADDLGVERVLLLPLVRLAGAEQS